MEFNNQGSKDPNRDDIPSGLLRQRRNLILISLSLFFIYYSGVKIETASLSLFGAELTLSNPKVFDNFIVLWIAWAYFLVRYTQYVKFYDVMKDINSEFYGHIQPLYNNRFLKTLEEAIPSGFSGKSSVYPRNVKFTVFSGFRYVGAGYIGKNYDQSAHIVNLNFSKALKCYLEASFELIITSRHVTDYWLPYLLALTPCLYILIA